eukprot:403375136
MVESQSDQKNFLKESGLPSIGCFLTILQYLGSKKKCKAIVSMIYKQGNQFYKKHIKQSTEFSTITYVPARHPMTLDMDVNNFRNILTDIVIFPQPRKLYLKARSDVHAIIELMDRNPKSNCFFVSLMFDSHIFHRRNYQDFLINSMGVQKIRTNAEGLLLFHSNLSQLHRCLISLILTVSIDQQIYIENDFQNFIPKSVKNLTLIFKESFKLAYQVIHEKIARFIQTNDHLQNLKLDHLIFFIKEIDEVWGNALQYNSHIKKLTLKNMTSNYEIGEKLWMGLKRREVKLQRFRLLNTHLNEYSFYYFTAFVRSHSSFTQFELINAFDNMNQKQREAKKDLLQYQQAQHQVLNELLSKDLGTLNFRNNLSNDLYDNIINQNAIETLLQGFNGTSLQISGGKFSKFQTKNQLLQSKNLQHFELNNIQISEATLVILLEALGQQENLKSLELVELNITTKNANILLPLRQCSKMRSLKFDRFLKGTYEPYEVVLRSLGPTIQEFTLVVYEALKIDHVSDVISHFDSNIIKNICLDVGNFKTVKNENYVASAKSCLEILQYYANLKKLSLHVGYIDVEVLDAFGSGLLKFGQKLQDLSLTINYSGISPQIKSKNTFTSVSSDQYQQLHESISAEQASQLFDTFSLGLASCINLKFLDLPRDMLDMPFFNSYYKALDENSVKSNLLRMTQVPHYKSSRPEIGRSFLF